ncbi:MAG TPA: helix-turn-helix domain-containing protein [Chryseosolibacter sp.]|nr:helix-turn-helix domain-containing protein [Chryseosolibacter sp.]
MAVKVKKAFKPVKIHIDVDKKLYLKDPNSSVLGTSIIRESISMIDEMGFEAFTFRKLATRIGATEPSIYRYFESKHKLLLYLLAWYWNWMDYKLIFATANIQSPEERLKVAIKLLSEPIEQDPNFDHVDETALYRIVVSESPKAYLVKEVDAVNKEGLFLGYKRLCNRVASIVQEVNPKYRFPRALISTIVESSHDQKYFAEHLPSLTDVTQSKLSSTTEFLTELVFRAINAKA